MKAVVEIHTAMSYNMRCDPRKLNIYGYDKKIWIAKTKHLLPLWQVKYLRYEGENLSYTHFSSVDRYVPCVVREFKPLKQCIKLW